MRARVHGVDQRPGLGELHQTLLEVGEWTIHQTVILLVVVEQMIPEWMSAQHLGVPHHDDSVLGSSQRNIETTRISQESNTLVFIAPDTGDDDDVLLSSLECVHTGNLNVLVDLGVE